jgi:GNAT superfamily N-acetyltransferase
MTGKPVIEKLRRDHDVETFDCGKEPLNRFLQRYALQNQQMAASQIYVAVRRGAVLGYYTLVFGEVAFADAPQRLRKGVARHPAPVMVLARLAVASHMMGHGLGSGLLRDAMLRTLQAAEIAGLRTVLVHANDEARSFYEHFDFTASPTDPMHLLVLLKDVRAQLGGRAAGQPDRASSPIP